MNEDAPPQLVRAAPYHCPRKMRQNGADLVYGPGRITTLAYRVHRMDAMLAFYSEALV